MTLQTPNTTPKWQFWIDRGGTFTDIIAVSPDGRQHAHKLLSENPAAYDDAAVEGMRRVLGVTSDGKLPSVKVTSVKMGTTVATNALLERKGAPVVLVMTGGLTDQLEIGTQARTDIFAQRIIKPDQLYRRVIAAKERMRANGTIETPLDVDHLKRALTDAYHDGLMAVAIVFMHAYAHPDHERQAMKIAKDIGFTQISASHDVSPLIKLVNRGDTSVADAYLSPVLKAYIDRVTGAFDQSGSGTQPTLSFMASSGGLTPARAFRGRDAILSGPAGGVIAMAKTANSLGFDDVIGFDMGGTSTDVAHYAGAFERSLDTVVAGVRLHVPMLAVETVAAGGGSILSLDGDRLRVGPESAGADPGPACYRRGGPLTVTDANVMVGKLNPKWFPHVFGTSGDEPLDEACVRAAFDRLSQTADGTLSPLQLADGAIRIAVENMANAIKKISVGRGHDVSRYALQCFGAAAGQHVCRVADTLGINTILVHPQSGVLSALGMGLADMREARVFTLEQPLNSETVEALNRRVNAEQPALCNALEQSGVAPGDITLTPLVHLKYDGSDSTLPVRLADLETMRADFEKTHNARYGFTSPEKDITVATLDIAATGGGVALADHDTLSDIDYDSAAPTELAETTFYSGGDSHQASVYKRTDLTAGHLIHGPAIVVEDHQTVVVESGWSARVSSHGVLVLNRTQHRRRRAVSTRADPVMLEVFNNHFMSIAEQMGAALENTAQSVNIKERLDFSCAIFDPQGQLVANAPHVPVHLGSMDRAVTTVLKHRGTTIQPGDAYMLNAPYQGGTHLPDITVVSPVFDDAQQTIDFFVASRGHHADVGGTTPGSMSPNAKTIEQEGVVIDNVQLVRDGRFLEDDVLQLLTNAPYPARNPAQNIADLKAQVAANARGAQYLRDMVALYGPDVVQAYMKHVQTNAENAVRNLLTQLEDGAFETQMDNGATVSAAVTIDRQAQTATIDFTGTSPQQDNNFNAPEPVTRAAVLYVIRVLLDKPIPINAGCLKPLNIIVPAGSMLCPKSPAAVVAGNVETSQVITNVLFGALRRLSSSQGTMNNLTFGDGSYQYYETICSGSPAGPGFDGTPAVQVHMTNTRLTDPEVLELRFPVVVDEYSICRGSGGQGQWHAGDGTRRVLRFLKPMSAALLSGYRRIAPFGMFGGSPGKTGRNSLHRADGSVEELAGCVEVRINPGDRMIIETPTGGGYGPIENRGKV